MTSRCIARVLGSLNLVAFLYYYFSFVFLIARVPGSLNLVTFLCYYFSFVFLAFSFPRSPGLVNSPRRDFPVRSPIAKSRGPGLVNGPRRDFPMRSPITRVLINLVTFLCYYFSFVFLVFSFLVFNYFMSPHSNRSVVLGILAVLTTLVTGTVERTTEHRGVTINH